jgi:hypothetical protein
VTLPAIEAPAPDVLPTSGVGLSLTERLRLSAEDSAATRHIATCEALLGECRRLLSANNDLAGRITAVLATAPEKHARD